MRESRLRSFRHIGKRNNDEIVKKIGVIKGRGTAAEKG